jgi:hypothetical protein
MLGYGYFAASSVFGMNYELPVGCANKLDFIKCNKQLFTNKFLPSQVVESNQAEHDKRKQEAITSNKKGEDHSNTPLSQWVHMYKQFVLAEQNAAEASKFRYEKNADHRGWAVEVRFRDTQTGPRTLDLYYDHFVHRTKFKGKWLRTIDAVLWFDKWFANGCPLDNPVDTQMAIKVLDGRYVLSLEKQREAKNAASAADSNQQQQAESNEAPAPANTPAAGVAELDDDAAMPDPNWAQRRRGIPASTSTPSASSTSVRNSVFKKPAHRSEQYAKMWYDTHSDTDPLFVWKIGTQQIDSDGRLKHFMAIDEKLQDNMHLRDATTPIFTWKEVSEMAKAIVNLTETKEGKRRMDFVNKKAKVCKRQRTDPSEGSSSTDPLPEAMIEEVD